MLICCLKQEDTIISNNNNNNKQQSVFSAKNGFQEMHSSCFSSTRVVVIIRCFFLYQLPAPSVLFGSVLDRYLPFMEPRELPRRPEPALPLQSGLGAGYPSLQQVGYPRNSPLRTHLNPLTCELNTRF